MQWKCNHVKFLSTTQKLHPKEQQPAGIQQILELIILDPTLTFTNQVNSVSPLLSSTWTSLHSQFSIIAC